MHSNNLNNIHSNGSSPAGQRQPMDTDVDPERSRNISDLVARANIYPVAITREELQEYVAFKRRIKEPATADYMTAQRCLDSLGMKLRSQRFEGTVFAFGSFACAAQCIRDIELIVIPDRRVGERPGNLGRFITAISTHPFSIPRRDGRLGQNSESLTRIAACWDDSIGIDIHVLPPGEMECVASDSARPLKRSESVPVKIECYSSALGKFILAQKPKDYVPHCLEVEGVRYRGFFREALLTAIPIYSCATDQIISQTQLQRAELNHFLRANNIQAPNLLDHYSFFINSLYNRPAFGMSDDLVGHPQYISGLTKVAIELVTQGLNSSQDKERIATRDV